jgi:RNA polymerase sigma factor (sigma-70 family)
MVEAEARANLIEEVYRSEGVKLWRSVTAYVGDPEVARDAVAEAFVQLLGRGDGVRDPARWVWTTAFRIAGAYAKERRRHVMLPEASYDMPEPVIDVIRALARLSPRQCSAVVLRHYGGYDIDEVAAILGTTNASVRVHLSVGRRRLRALLEATDG